MSEKISKIDPNDYSGYEKSDADVRKTFVVIIAGIIVLALILVWLNEYFSYSKEKEIYEIVLKPESRELIDLRAREDMILNSYGVVDSLRGIYRIPIDSAMREMLGEAGMPNSKKQ